MTPFTLTESAKEQMTYLLSKNPGKDAVHLQVKGGGCAGFKYEWGFVNNDEIEKTAYLGSFSVSNCGTV